MGCDVLLTINVIDHRIQELIAEDEETMSVEEARAMALKAVREKYALPNCDMTPDELYHAIEQEIDFIYVNV